MKLSEAIRKGSKLRGKAHCNLYDGLVGTSCALGAAYEATQLAGVFTKPLTDYDGSLVKSSEEYYHLLRAEYPILRNLVPNPFDEFVELGINGMTVEGAIFNMNDGQHMTRETIADVVEKIEHSLHSDVTLSWPQTLS